jgi:hypothetical protein
MAALPDDLLSGDDARDAPFTQARACAINHLLNSCPEFSSRSGGTFFLSRRLIPRLLEEKAR